jgi:hypothetical protein
MGFIILFSSSSSFFFSQYWRLNSGPHACEAGVLPLEPLHQPRYSIFLHAYEVLPSCPPLSPPRHCQVLVTQLLLVTQEAEIRRISVWSQPRQIVQEALSRKTHHKKRTGGIWWSCSRYRPWVQTPVLQKKKKDIVMGEKTVFNKFCCTWNKWKRMNLDPDLKPYTKINSKT